MRQREGVRAAIDGDLPSNADDHCSDSAYKHKSRNAEQRNRYPGQWKIRVSVCRISQEAGLDGVVASPLEVSAIQGECGSGFQTVTPGIRPAGSELGDQTRSLTPGEAISKGQTLYCCGASDY